MKNNKKVLYTGAFRFPDKDAAAFRVQGVADLFTTAGYQVDFAGWECHDEKVKKYSYNGYECYPQCEFRTKRVNPFLRTFGFLLRGHKTIRWLIKNRSEYSIVVVYNPPAFFSLLMFIICKYFHIKLILDSTEWYESEHLPGGKFGLASLENWLRMRLVYFIFSNIIVISEFLRDHFNRSNTILILPVSSSLFKKDVVRPKPESELFLIYAGEAGKKDKLLPIISMLSGLSKKIGIKVSMNIVGITLLEFEKLLTDNNLKLTDYQAHVNCYGRVSREKVMALYEQSHFSILFRDSKRYALAGFPTKAMESMVKSCPLITNAIGDLSYMLNYENSIILDETLIDLNLSLLIKNAIEPARYSDLCSKARSTALRYFDPSVYREKFILFLNSLV